MAEERNRWKEALTGNVGTKLVALVLALTAWYAIQHAISFESIVTDVPVRVLVDDGWAVLEQSASSVDVHFRGSREGIRYLQQEQLEVVADARGMRYGETVTVPIELGYTRTPGSVRPVYIRPDTLVLSMDQEVDREFPVRIHVQGEPPDGYAVEAMVAKPDRVVVSGPRQRLDTIEAIRTTPIDLAERLQSFSLRVGLVPPSRTWTARIEPERVEVEITLIERSASSVFTDVPVKILWGSANRLRRATLDPAASDLVVEGRAELLAGLTIKDVQVYVDLSEADPGTTRMLPLRVHLPSGVRLQSLTPQAVQATVESP